MSHVCNQAEKFDKIQKTVDVIKLDVMHIQEDRAFQDSEREKRLIVRAETDAAIDAKLDKISNQVKDLLELNQEVNDFKSFWKVGKNIGLGLAAVITFFGIIFGSVIAIKNWINH